MITPQTDVILLNVSISKDQLHQIDFTNKQAQYNYFMTQNPYNLGTDFTYQRKDGTMRVGMEFDQLQVYNYVMYRNDVWNDKWFYAFITDITYLNNGTSLITLKTDVFQTYMFDWTIHPSFIERETVASDDYFEHLYPENLEMGEYIYSKLSQKLLDFGLYWYVFLTSKRKNGQAYVNEYNGVISGLNMYAFDNVVDCADFITFWQDTPDVIQMIYVIPKGILKTTDIESDGLVKATATGVNVDLTFHLPINQTFTDYVPKNKKLYSSPYVMYELTNNTGQTAEYAPEMFAGITSQGSQDIDFKMIGNISNNPSALIYPTNYKAISRTTTTNFEDGISITGFPQCAWVSDFYASWQAQNSFGNQITLQMANANNTMNAISSATRLDFAGTFGAISNMANTAFNLLSETRKAQITPPQVHGSMGSSNSIIAQKQMGFFLNVKVPKGEYVKIIDNYFSMFGYKINDTYTPNLKSRSNWNYIKCLDMNITGAIIPEKDIEELKGIFNNGITIWHNPNTFLDYSQNNNIV